MPDRSRGFGPDRIVVSGRIEVAACACRIEIAAFARRIEIAAFCPL
jgi:hypothetical protein